jgi:hypothetical protein
MTSYLGRRRLLPATVVATGLVGLLPVAAGANDGRTTLGLARPAHTCAALDKLHVTVTVKHAHRNGTFQLAAGGTNEQPYGTVSFHVHGTSYHHRLTIVMNGPLPEGRSTVYYTLDRRVGKGAYTQLTFGVHKSLPKCS